MSYADQQSRGRPVTIAAVAALHLAIGYAFISGLAVRVFTHIPVVTTTSIIPDDVPPPEHAPPPATPRTASQPRPQPQSPPTFIRHDDAPAITVDLGPLPSTISADSGPPTALASSPPAQPSQARDATPSGNHAGWVTTDDYPAQALRDGAAGVVGIAVLVGVDGRVAGCTVTASSGNAQLDEATCRTYSRRARFRPALDSEGNPVSSHHADRIRWQIPAQ